MPDTKWDESVSQMPVRESKDQGRGAPKEVRGQRIMAEREKIKAAPVNPIQPSKTT